MNFKRSAAKELLSVVSHSIQTRVLSTILRLRVDVSERWEDVIYIKKYYSSMLISEHIFSLRWLIR